uniref:U-box domain-containing protein n=1 Tax=Oryza brachyantha TaxID=4533 RepID=J3MCX7_ORYBR
MVLPMLRRSRKEAARGGEVVGVEEEVAVPAHFRCPISLELMRDPVTAATGITYDRECLERWLERGHGSCPVTGRPVRMGDLVPNHATRRMIQDWCVANRARGVERVPTPRVPVGEADAEEAIAEGTSEKALAVLDAALCTDAGVESARAHALTVPVLVKKMFRVSDMATDFAVSALWRLCRTSGSGAGSCRAEALRVGAFQKLLLLLQVGCAGVTKERASELLKMLNGSRGSVECIETVDFKGLKRPF